MPPAALPTASATRPWTRREALAAFAAGAGCFVLQACAPAAGPASEAPAPRAEPGPTPAAFPQGVASGDPTPDSVVLWTRAEPPAGQPAARLRLRVEPLGGAGGTVFERLLEAGAETDFTVRVIVTGLRPGTAYRYVFASASASAEGRTRTAPAADDPAPVRLAWASCQSYEGGFYGAWRRLLNEDAARPEAEQVQFVLHVGDFIYENLGYGKARQLPPLPDGRARTAEGDPAASSLADYRHLYRRYLADPDLQAARARWPFVNTWDDHEFANDCWQSITTYAVPDEPAQARKLWANRAWFEFIPAFLTGLPPSVGVPQQARDFAPAEVSDAPADVYAVDEAGLVDEPNNKAALASLTIYRSFRWGRHVELLLTDLRSYRSNHALPEELNLLLTKSANYLSPVPLVEVCDAGRTANGGQPPENFEFAGQSFPNPRKAHPVGTVLGPAQKAWFKATLKASRATWKLWASSLPVMPLRFDFQNADPKLPECVFTSDSWDGFPGESRELMEFVRDEGVANLVSLCGDHHAFFAGLTGLNYNRRDFRPLAVEFAVAGISSKPVFLAAVEAVPPEDPRRALFVVDSTKFGGADPAVENMNLTLTHGVKAGFAYGATGSLTVARLARNPLANPHLRHTDFNSHGVATLRAEAGKIEVEFITIEDPATPRGEAGAEVRRRARFTVPAWAPGAAPELRPPAFEGPPPFPLGA